MYCVRGFLMYHRSLDLFVLKILQMQQPLSFENLKCHSFQFDGRSTESTNGIAIHGFPMPSFELYTISLNCSPCEIEGSGTECAPSGTGVEPKRRWPAAWFTPVCGPPKGHPLPSVTSTRSPSRRAAFDVN